jgi:hypothetical protein
MAELADKRNDSADPSARSFLFRIVDNNAHGMPLAGAQPADAVPQIDPIIAFGSLHLTVVNGKSHCISLS